MNTTVDTFEAQFAALTGLRPFRWQARLFRRFANGDVPSTLDLPTGLGKTSVMALWLLARAHGAMLPRRLVYVVDRRAVVDQATAEAERLRGGIDRTPELKSALGLGDRPLPISTLRGQFVDNREWLADPAAPGIIVGTVDMIGSRLMFSGYGVSARMRPYHAGLLGADALIVLDEAHLVPPFQRLLQRIADGDDTFGPKDRADRQIVPQFRLLPLSATGLSSEQNPFCLTPEDRGDPIVSKRLSAAKKLTIDDLQTGQLATRLAKEAWELTESGTAPLRCIVYCDRREDAEKAKKLLDELAQSKRGLTMADTELFVGARRVKEREDAKDWLQHHGFLAGSDAMLECPAILIATSAGEVGVDLDADHMVCDLVAWERMVQRLGRVNRRGERGDTEVRIIDASGAEKDAPRVEMLARTRSLLLRLPAIESGRNASPGELLDLRDKREAEEIKAASTPEPLRPALTRALVDAWSMTSLEEHTGRPKIDPWLRGWVEDDRPQTAVVWRTYLPVRLEGGNASAREVEDFFAVAPPHASEILETETWRVVDWLIARATAVLKRRRPETEANGDRVERVLNQSSPRRLDWTDTHRLNQNDIVGFALSPAGSPQRVYRLRALAEAEKDKKRKDALNEELAGMSLIVDARLRGLSRDGMLDGTFDDLPPTADDTNADKWLLPLPNGRPVVRFRVHPPSSVEPPLLKPSETHIFVTRRSDEGEDTERLFTESWATEDSRAASSRPQLLAEHGAWTEQRALAIAEALGLTDDQRKALGIAARLHDEGKQAMRWQRAFSASGDGIYAKTVGPVRRMLLDGYRHEFGSLPYVEKSSEVHDLPEDLRELVLHLVASHHGFARPLIKTRGCEDAPPSALEGRARDVALRFALLQKRWGPWGLAWWEALLRAADAQASRDNDEGRSPYQLEKA
jgi:CRISPR-associated endonuclease/helicase Cas3